MWRCFCDSWELVAKCSERSMPFNLQKVLNAENECYSLLWKWGKGESISWTNLAAYLISAEKYCENSESQWGLVCRGAGLSWQLWAEFPALSRSLPCDLLQIALCHRLAAGPASPALYFSQAETFSVPHTYQGAVQLSVPLLHYWSIFLALRILVSVKASQSRKLDFLTPSALLTSSAVVWLLCAPLTPGFICTMCPSNLMQILSFLLCLDSYLALRSLLHL